MIPSPIPTDTQRFARRGRSRQLIIESAADLRGALELDIAHWVANSAPISTINADPVFLDYLDDGDGRVRAEEVQRAIVWTLARLSSMQNLEKGANVLELEHIQRDEFPALLTSAKRILRLLGTPDATRIALHQVRKVRLEEQAQGLSESGLVIPVAAQDDATEALLHDVLATVGGEPHPHAPAAVSEEKLALFLEQLQAHVAWRERGQREGVDVLGEETAQVAKHLATLGPKYQQFFTLCDALLLDASLKERSWLGGNTPPSTEDLLTPAVAQQMLERAPLARPNPDGVIAQDERINPAYREPFMALERLLDAGAPRARASFQALAQLMAPFDAWMQQEPEVQVGSLSPERQAEILADTQVIQAVRELIERSKANAVVLDRVKELEKLILFQSLLIKFTNSFISFPDLYDATQRALFERGTLIVDGRRLTLAIRVPDRERHARFSDESNIFVLYTEIMDRAGEVLFEVAVPVTHGGRGNLLESKWGVFEDPEGKAYHAHVVKLVDNPISLWEAVTAPFKKLAETLDERLEAMSEKRKDTFVTKTAGALEAERARAPASSATKKPAAPASSGGMLAGGAVAFAAVGSSLAFITSKLQELGWQKLLLGVLLILLSMMVPLVASAWLKLRRRDLSALLEGSGWGINARMCLTREQARTFTFTPRYPEHARGTPAQWWIGAAVVVLVLVMLAAAWAQRSGVLSQLW